MDFDDLTDRLPILFDIFNAIIVLNDTRNAQVEGAEHDALLDVLDEGKDISVYLEQVDVVDISVDEAVADALAGVRQDLVVEFGGALVDLTALGHIIDDLLVEDVHSPHFLVDQREVLDVLRRILDHGLGQGALLPEVGIILHLGVDLVLLGVHLAGILFKEVVEADVDVPVIVMLKEVRNQPVCDLRVKYEVANQVVLANEGGGVFAEIVEDLHDLVGFEHLFESMVARIHSPQIDDEALVGKVNLDELHAPALGKTLAVKAQNGGLRGLCSVKNRLGKLLEFPRL